MLLKPFVVFGFMGSLGSPVSFHGGMKEQMDFSDSMGIAQRTMELVIYLFKGRKFLFISNMGLKKEKGMTIGTKKRGMF